jgi:hypothetical protein
MRTQQPTFGLGPVRALVRRLLLLSGLLGGAFLLSAALAAPAHAEHIENAGGAAAVDAGNAAEDVSTPLTFTVGRVSDGKGSLQSLTLRGRALVNKPADSELPLPAATPDSATKQANSERPLLTPVSDPGTQLTDSKPPISASTPHSVTELADSTTPLLTTDADSATELADREPSLLIPVPDPATELTDSTTPLLTSVADSAVELADSQLPALPSVSDTIVPPIEQLAEVSAPLLASVTATAPVLSAVTSTVSATATPLVKPAEPVVELVEPILAPLASVDEADPAVQPTVEATTEAEASLFSAPAASSIEQPTFDPVQSGTAAMSAATPFLSPARSANPVALSGVSPLPAPVITSTIGGLPSRLAAPTAPAWPQETTTSGSLASPSSLGSPLPALLIAASVDPAALLLLVLVGLAQLWATWWYDEPPTTPA